MSKFTFFSIITDLAYLLASVIFIVVLVLIIREREKELNNLKQKVYNEVAFELDSKILRCNIVVSNEASAKRLGK